MFKFSSKVGHLILRALAIRESDPQNAIPRTSFHSAKRKFLQFASKRVCSSQKRSFLLYFRRHVYLITDGSIVTSSITFYISCVM